MGWQYGVARDQTDRTGAQVREIVYLSESKLRQFVPEPRRVPRAGALRVTTPLGGIDMDAPTANAEQGQLRHLRDVSKHVELIADWYAKPDLRPGQWVQFEAPLRCVTLGGAHQDLVLFVDPAGRGRADSMPDDGCRLLMHGSVRHLRGWAPMAVDGPALEMEDSAFSLGTAFVTRVGQVVEALTKHRDPLQPEQTPSREAVRLHGQGVQELLDVLDDEDDSINMSAMMTGYARVTGLLPGARAASRCVVASPLVVEYVAADSP
ncbi:SAVMC3_10250 family protein [Streptomyces sp. NPDC002055]|uniref:SAVMC3_10250 family protein n=1 Tax=Streptomyces sp. NPDC002055 TaxID=3154534 RepID=UPI003328F933